MSILDYNLDEVPEQHPVEDGEYTLRIVKATLKKSKKNQDMIENMLTVEGESDAPPIFHYVMLPDDSADDEATKNNKLRRLRTFCQCFGIDYSNGIDVEAFKGETGEAIIKTEEDAEYGERNVVQRFTVSN